MTVYDFPTHIKGDTFRARQIDFGFDITNAEIKMQFKLRGASKSTFEWSTVDNSFSIDDAALGLVTMNSRIIDVNPATYIYDLQIKDSNNNVTTYFKGSIIIEQDITI